MQCMQSLCQQICHPLSEWFGNICWNWIFGQYSIISYYRSNFSKQCMYGFYIYHSFSFVGFEYQTVGWRSACWSPPPLPLEKIRKGTTYQFLILSTTDICKLLIKKNLSVSVTLTSLRLQSQATYQLSIISMGPAPDWHFSPTHPCTFLLLLFLQIWTLLIWQTAKYCLAINLAMGENFLRDLGGETINQW